MINFKDVFELIKKHEGFSKKLYKCPAGKLTIGYGRNIEDCGISKDEAEYFLKNDILKSIDDLYFIFGYDFFNSLNDEWKIVLIDMMYNLGANGFKRFKRMIKAIKMKDFESAINEMKDSKWYHQVGDRSKNLISIVKDAE